MFSSIIQNEDLRKVWERFESSCPSSSDPPQLSNSLLLEFCATYIQVFQAQIGERVIYSSSGYLSLPIPVLQTLLNSVQFESLFLSNVLDYTSENVQHVAMLIRTVTLASCKQDDPVFNNSLFSKITALLGFVMSSTDHILSLLGKCLNSK